MNTTTLPQPKVRNSNLELYRILLMLAIVAHHYVINSGLKDLMDSDPFAPRSLFLYIIGMWGKVGINCFVLITGYFMCKSEITLWKFLKLVLEILFYNFAINLSFVIIGVIDFSLRDFLWRLSPVHGIRRDFVSCYFFFFLLIPFLNILVRNMKQQQHKLLLSLILCMYTVLSVFPGFPLEVNYVTWFCVIFLIGSYLRLYPYKESNTLFWIIAFVTSVIMTITSIFPLLYVKRFGLDLGAYYLVIDSNKPLALFVSICAFMLFKNMKIKQSKFINTVGGGTFGVLLIHNNSDTMRQWLWGDVCNNTGHYMYSDIYLHAVLVPIAVFIVCSVIEYIRMRTVETPFLNLTYKTVRYFSKTLNTRSYVRGCRGGIL